MCIGMNGRGRLVSLTVCAAVLLVAAPGCGASAGSSADGAGIELADVNEEVSEADGQDGTKTDAVGADDSVDTADSADIGATADTADPPDGAASDTSANDGSGVSDAQPGDVSADGAAVDGAGGSDGGDAVAVDAAVDAGADAGPDATDASSDAASDGSGSAVQCGTSPSKFPVFAKGCAADGECFVALHQVNCCGTQVALGLSKGEASAFEAAEKQCVSQYPGCGCAQFATQAEDGFFGWAAADFKASCQAGVCRSALKDPKPNCTSTGLAEPKAPKACQKQSDCTTLLQTIDCCGSQKAVGVAKYAKDAMEAAELKCTQAISICDCATKPVVAEDGQAAGDGLIAVQCEAGACMSYIK